MTTPSYTTTWGSNTASSPMTACAPHPRTYAPMCAPRSNCCRRIDHCPSNARRQDRMARRKRAPQPVKRPGRDWRCAASQRPSRAGKSGSTRTAARSGRSRQCSILGVRNKGDLVSAGVLNACDATHHPCGLRPATPPLAAPPAGPGCTLPTHSLGPLSFRSLGHVFLQTQRKLGVFDRRLGQPLPEAFAGLASSQQRTTCRDSIALRGTYIAQGVPTNVRRRELDATITRQPRRPALDPAVPDLRFDPHPAAPCESTSPRCVDVQGSCAAVAFPDLRRRSG